jgi:Nickel responsive protein SCO4226-like
MAVPVFLVERRFAEDLEASAEVTDRINRINEEEGVRWLFSFLAADKRKTYCLYEAPEADAIRRAASRAGLPADAVAARWTTDPSARFWSSARSNSRSADSSSRSTESSEAR